MARRITTISMLEQILAKRQDRKTPGFFRAARAHAAKRHRDVALAQQAAQGTVIGGGKVLTAATPAFVSAGAWAFATSGTLTPAIPGAQNSTQTLISCATGRSGTGINLTLSGAGWSMLSNWAIGSIGDIAVAVSAGDNTTVPTWTINSGTLSAAVVCRYSGLNTNTAAVLDSAGQGRPGTPTSSLNIGPVSAADCKPTVRDGLILFFGAKWDNDGGATGSMSTTDGLTWTVCTSGFSGLGSHIAVAVATAPYNNTIPTLDATYAVPVTGATNTVTDKGLTLNLKASYS
jgi:hypothetical protein